jgi:hypothetical protein
MSAFSAEKTKGNGDTDRADKIGSIPEKAKNTLMEKGSSTYESLSGDLTRETYSQNRIVTMLFSAAGQSLSSFQWDVRDELISRTNGRTDGSGFEHQASISEKKEKVNGTDSIRFAAVIQTSNSPVISIDSERLVGNGWKYRSDLGMHTHGFMDGKYKLTSIDVAYLNSSGVYRSIGDRGDKSLGGDVDDFSVQDASRRKQSFLATPDGIKRRYQDGKRWRVESLKRPKQ